MVELLTSVVMFAFSNGQSLLPIGPKWGQIAIDGEAYYDSSGWSVALSSDGKTVAVGAPDDDTGNESADGIGHVRIFQRTEALSSDGKTVAVITIMEMVFAVVMYAYSNGQSLLPIGGGGIEEGCKMQKEQHQVFQRGPPP
jgi:hypothetical protein